ncbi:hypothetical protein SEF58_02465 [Neomoorella humiferrea]|uniref:hypothetical protein n=1 Tax=Neomoorella humiferrea TaxID=676965 RepID=UPI0030CAC020
MIVVTISKWRQKLVLILAAILVAAVLLGQLARGGNSKTAGQRETLPKIQQTQQPAVAPASGTGRSLEGLLERLRGFYRGE